MFESISHLRNKQILCETLSYKIYSLCNKDKTTITEYRRFKVNY